MEGMRKILKLLGFIFLAVGALFLLICIAILLITRCNMGGVIGGSITALFSVIWGGIGGGMLIGASASNRSRQKIINKGTRHTGKIYGYVEDRAIKVNNSYPINIVVRYFDNSGTEREVIIPTKFARGSGAFPIGATIDFVLYKSTSTWIDGSVRNDPIAREDELMDNIPLYSSQLTMRAVTCPTCGASYTAAQGYAAACPYCGHAVNL